MKIINLKNSNLKNIITPLIKSGTDIIILNSRHYNLIVTFYNNNTIAYSQKDLLITIKLLDKLYQGNHYKDNLKNGVSNYKDYLNILINLNIIKDTSAYKVSKDGVRGWSKEYIINNKEDKNMVLITLSDIDASKEFKEREEKGLKIDSKPVLETLNNIMIDIDKAIFLNQQKTFYSDNYIELFSRRIKNIIRFVNSDKWIYRHKDCGRVYSSLTQLEKETRNSLYLMGDGTRVYFDSYDLSNAIPVILFNMIKTTDIQLLCDLRDGTFYNNLVKEMDNTEYYKFYDKKGNYNNNTLRYNSRDDVKTMVMKSILYGSSPNKTLMTAFETLYRVGSLELTIFKLNNKDRNISNLLQIVESKLFTYFNIKNTFNVHDSIYFLTTEDKDKFKKLLDDKWEEMFNNTLSNFKFDKNISADYSITINSDKVIIIEESKLSKWERKERKSSGKRDKTIQLIDIVIRLKLEGKTVAHIVKETGLKKSRIYKIIKNNS